MKRLIQLILILVCSGQLHTVSASDVFGDEINPNPIVNAPDNQFVRIVSAIFKPGTGVIMNPCFDVWTGYDKSRRMIETCRQSFKERVSSAADDAGIRPLLKPGENQCKFGCNFKLMKYSSDPRIWDRAAIFMKGDPALTRGYEGIKRGALEDPGAFELALTNMVKRYQVK